MSAGGEEKHLSMRVLNEVKTKDKLKIRGLEKVR